MHTKYWLHGVRLAHGKGRWLESHLRMYDIHTYVQGQSIVNTSVHMPVCACRGCLSRVLAGLHFTQHVHPYVHCATHSRLYTMYTLQRYIHTYIHTYSTVCTQICTYVQYICRYVHTYAPSPPHHSTTYVHTYVCTYLQYTLPQQDTPHLPHTADYTPHYCTSLIFPLSSTSIDLVSEVGSSKVGLGRERGCKFCGLRLVDRDMWTVRVFALPGDTTDGVVTVEPTAAPLPVPPEGTDMLSSSVAIVYCW